MQTRSLEFNLFQVSKIAFRSLLIILGTALSGIQVASAQPKAMQNANYEMKLSGKGVSYFSTTADTVNLLSANTVWGNVLVNYRVNAEDWNKLTTDKTRFLQVNDSVFRYTDSIPDMPLCMKRTYTLNQDGLRLKIEIATTGKQAVELGDVALPVGWRFPGDAEIDRNPASVFEAAFIPKQSISLNSSFLYFSKPIGKGPFYLMLTGKGTPLEYFDNLDNTYKVYIHSACTGAKTSGKWRWPHTSKVLAPVGESNSSITYEFLLVSAPRYEALRETVYRNGLLDVRAAPGYTVPRDLTARVALRLKGEIKEVVPEFPQQTEVKAAGKSPDGAWLYDVRFNRLGENLLTVRYNSGEQTALEFFSTEPVETLIKKRSSFIVNHQQHKVPGKWWDGLYSVYDMKYGRLRGPEDTDGFDGWWGYVLACDDPALGKAPFVAAKNAVYPDSSEVASLEYYVKNFVWGGLQRTDKEVPYPYAIYGVPNWHVARDSALHAPYGNERPKIWRAYDYPHIIKLYYHLFQIAQNTPQYTHYLNADQYFERAVQTAFAYFKYPYQVWDWFEMYKWGIYNEWVVPELIAELARRGRQKDAQLLQGEWEKKAKYFIYDDKYPYRSEMSFDRTAFESSFALAKYAVETPMQPDKNLWYDKNKKKWYSHPQVSTADAQRFMDQQHYAGLAVRGWMEPKFYQAGADGTSVSHTHDLSYMTMMGGWSVLEYALYYSANKDWLELGYNSYLSSWALMNTGDEQSNYGYWYPGKEKDGATGWAFVSAKKGITWIRKQEERGVWRYDGEIDLGYGAAFHTARTIIVQDSAFGLHAYGGNLVQDGSSLTVIPNDGVRQQFSLVLPQYRLHLSLKRDGFLNNQPIRVSPAKKSMEFVLENRNPVAGKENTTALHTTILELRSLNAVPRQAFADGKPRPLVKTQTGWELSIPVSERQQTIRIDWK